MLFQCIQHSWAPLYTNSLALPREVRYDARLEQLVFSPLPEQALLRNGTLARKAAVMLHPGAALRLRATVQAEAQLAFAIPPKVRQAAALN